jgi:hypothetical protein
LITNSLMFLCGVPCINASCQTTMNKALSICQHQQMNHDTVLGLPFTFTASTLSMTPSPVATSLTFAQSKLC